MHMLNSKRILPGYAAAVAVCALGVALVQTGCEKFTQNKPSVAEFRLPKPKMEQNSVALAIGIAELGPEQKSEFAALIAKADWLDMDLSHRKRLDENGLGVALLPGSAINHLDQVLLANDGDKPRTRLTTYRRAESRIGEGIVAAVSQPAAQIHWQEYHDGTATEDSATDAHCVFRIVATPHQSDRSQVRLTFTPEVHYGAKKSWIGVEDKAFAFEQRQAIKAMPGLSFDVVVGQSDTIVISPTVAMERLGQLFFGSDPSSDSELAQARQDKMNDLFPMLAKGTEDSEIAGQKVAPWQRILIVRLVDSKIEL